MNGDQEEIINGEVEWRFGWLRVCGNEVSIYCSLLMSHDSKIDYFSSCIYMGLENRGLMTSDVSTRGTTRPAPGDSVSESYSSGS